MDGSGSNPFGYSAAIWRRFNATPGAGTLANACVGRARSRAAELELELYLAVDSGQIGAARFQALGCPTTIAVGQWLTEWLPGHSLDEAGRLGSRDIVAALEIRDDRLHCALLGEDALRAALVSGIGA